MTGAAAGSGTPGAVLWMGGAVLSFSAMALAGRELAADLDTFELMTWRSLTGLAIVGAVGIATGRLGQIRTRRLGLHATRNVFHFTGQNLWFYGVATIPLAQVFAFEFMTPIWVALLAPLLLGERLTQARLIAALLGFAGILVVARPGLTPLEDGHLAAALCAIFFAGNVIATKRLAEAGESTWTILFWMTAMQAVFGVVCALAVDGHLTVPTGETLGFVLAVGVCGLTAHLCIASALALAPAIVVAPLDFARLPLIAVLAAAIYGEDLEFAVIAGGATILAANLVNLNAERRR